MKLTKFVCAACLLAGFAFLSASEEAPPEHRKWMKDLGDSLGQLRKGVEVETNATQMAAVMDHVTEWWAKRPSDVAAKSSKDSRDGALQVVQAAKAGDKQGVSAGMKLIGAGCKGCHDVHREKVSETEYRIK